MGDAVLPETLLSPEYVCRGSQRVKGISRKQEFSIQYCYTNIYESGRFSCVCIPFSFTIFEIFQ